MKLLSVVFISFSKVFFSIVSIFKLSNSTCPLTFSSLAPKERLIGVVRSSSKQTYRVQVFQSPLVLIFLRMISLALVREIEAPLVLFSKSLSVIRLAVKTLTVTL